MTTHERAPLDAEERALAALLARHAPEGAPSPELDARILALARDGDEARPASAAAGAPPVAGRSPRTAPARRRHWPTMLGVAASLALAVGVAWQLRPVPDPEPTLVPGSEPAPVAAARMPTQTDARARTHSAPATSPAPPPADPASAAVAAPATPPVDDAPAATPDATPERDAVPAPPARAPVPPPASSVSPASPAPAAEAASGTPPSATRQAPASDAAPPPPRTTASAAAPPDADAPPTPSPAFAAGPVRPGANATAIGRRAVTAPAPAPVAAVRRSVASTAPVLLQKAPIALGDDDADDEAPALDEAFDEAPPATADSPEVHRAWLQRIRELRDAGRTDAARESLDELRRRFPDLRVPEDLEPLGHPSPR